jgi:hypothetical protein
LGVAGGPRDAKVEGARCARCGRRGGRGGCLRNQRWRCGRRAWCRRHGGRKGGCDRGSGRDDRDRLFAVGRATRSERQAHGQQEHATRHLRMSGCGDRVWQAFANALSAAIYRSGQRCISGLARERPAALNGTRWCFKFGSFFAMIAGGMQQKWARQPIFFRFALCKPVQPRTFATLNL